MSSISATLLQELSTAVQLSPSGFCSSTVLFQASLVVCPGEVQACADAASERVQALETQLDTQSTDAEAAAAAAQAQLESAQAAAAATLIAVKAEMKAALGATETELASTKVLQSLHAWFQIHKLCHCADEGCTQLV